MTPTRLILPLISLLVLAPAGGSQAPASRIRGLTVDSAAVRLVQLDDGSQVYGRIVDVSDSIVVIVADFGTFRIPPRAIRRVSKTTSVARTAAASGRAEYWFENPNATRLIFAPTGRMLSRGEGYFSDYMLFFPGIAVGVTNSFTIGGGVSIFPGDEQVAYLTPKVGIVQSPKVNLAVGALIAAVPQEDLLGILYGVGTFGSTDASATLGLGFGWDGDGLADRPVGLVGGEMRVSRRVALITENWIVPAIDPVFSYGLRFMGEHMAVDLALVRPAGADGIGPGIPWLDFIVNF